MISCNCGNEVTGTNICISAANTTQPILQLLDPGDFMDRLNTVEPLHTHLQNWHRNTGKAGYQLLDPGDFIHG